ncbi:MAG TPA: MarR family transcriptional regulator [Galbitalea sp.]|nr:MarR family transcriptional regulator [Galbitalea sp.]
MKQHPTNAADATLLVSRALLGVVARSVSSALEFVTLPQFRVLVVLSASGPIRMGALADRVHANQSTFSRSMDKIVAGGWAERSTSPDSRREVLISLTPAGRALVDEVTERRHAEISAILERLTPSEQDSVRAALELFAIAAGEYSVEELLVLGI